MSIKEEAKQYVDELPDDATWDDLVKNLMRHRKITLGMTDLEVVQDHLTEAELSAIIARLHSSSSRPDDMRDTKTYEPGNAVTLGMLSGVIAIFTAFVFPPISWVAALVAVVSGAIGIKRGEEKAWVPILMSMVSIVPLLLVID